MLTEKRNSFKPFSYPWAYDYYVVQNKIHWIPEEVTFANDIRDWNQNLSDGQIELLTQIFRFFTQADIDVASGYYDRYIPQFKAPEIRMMLGAFAAMEGVHIDAYSTLLETVGMPDTEYQAFLEYEEMVDKHEYMFNQDTTLTSDERIARDLAVFSAFGEGLQLFSSFAILMSFPRFGLMKGMGTIVEWSIRDESLHVEGMTKLFEEYRRENPHIWHDRLKKAIYQACRDMVELEDRFIDLAFDTGEAPGIDADEVKLYIRYMADRRLLQLGLKPNFGVTEHPLPWLQEMLNATSHANFFETRGTEYSKGSLTGDWSNAY